jgi:hypothetical protein
MGTTTIRIRPATRDRLARIGARRGLSTPDLLEELVTRAEEDELVAGLNQDFEALRRDRRAWREHETETAAWDRTSSDAPGAR